MNRSKDYKPKFGLERLFLAWFPANLFVRHSLSNVESLHDYTIAPHPNEVPYHDVKDKMIGSIRMLCFWINVNILYRSGNHFLLFLKKVVNYIKHHGKEPFIAPDTYASQAAESQRQVLPPEDSEVDQIDGKMKLESWKRESEEECNLIQDDSNQVAASGCVAW